MEILVTALIIVLFLELQIALVISVVNFMQAKNLLAPTPPQVWEATEEDLDALKVAEKMGATQGKVPMSYDEYKRDFEKLTGAL